MFTEPSKPKSPDPLLPQQTVQADCGVSVSISLHSDEVRVIVRL